MVNFIYCCLNQCHNSLLDSRVKCWVFAKCCTHSHELLSGFIHVRTYLAMSYLSCLIHPIFCAFIISNFIAAITIYHCAIAMSLSMNVIWYISESHWRLCLPATELYLRNATVWHKALVKTRRSLGFHSFH
jgi:hypothetical protein